MKKTGVMILSLLIALSVAILPVSAEGGAGSGDGTGGGKDKPLAVEKTVPAEGGSYTSGDPIVFTFSKNTAHLSVKDKNATLFSFTDENGKEIPFTVEITDEQIQPDRRNDISVTPKATLEGGKKYHLVAKAGIGSKSGNVMAEDYTLTFVVAGESKLTKVEPQEEETNPDTGGLTKGIQSDALEGQQPEQQLFGNTKLVIAVTGAGLLVAVLQFARKKNAK